MCQTRVKAPAALCAFICGRFQTFGRRWEQIIQTHGLTAASKTSSSASGPYSPQHFSPTNVFHQPKGLRRLTCASAPPYLAPSLLWKRTKALWSPLHATVKIEHRCWAIYAQPKTLFYSHINSMESTRLISHGEAADVTRLTKFWAFEVLRW